MARTALAPQEISRAGLNPVLSAANVDGHWIVNDGKTYLEVLNGSGASINVTLVISKTIDGVTSSGKVIAVPAGERRKIGPFPADIYNQADGSVNVNFSAVTTVTVGAFRVP